MDIRNTDSKYFAGKEAKELIPILKRKAEDWFETITTNNYLEKVKRSWLAYHGAYFNEYGGGGHSISFSGEQGELVNLPVNHYRNLAQHLHVMITANRPTFQTKAVNTDSKSLEQAKLGNNLLEYYMRAKRLDRKIKKVAELGIVMGSGFLKMEWNATAGKTYDHDEESDAYQYEGDVEFKVLSVYDVVFDSTKEDYEDMDWVITRTWKNKHDLIAKYPEHKEKILAIHTKSDIQRYLMLGSAFDETEDIPVFEFYHKETEALGSGRYFMYVGDDIMLVDNDLQYRQLPVYRLAPSEMLGTPYGYTNMFDLLPLQDALNSLNSTVLTNQSAFGVQNIWVPRGSDLSVQHLYGGLNVIEGNGEAGNGVSGKPESLQLTNTPAEIFNYLEKIEQNMETLSGVSAMARGNPDPNLKSGTAMALIQSQSLQFVSGLQHSYIELIEDVGTGLLNLLKDNASSPRITAIVGNNNKSEVESFSGEDLNLVDRVSVDVGNALSQTVSGRIQMAENLMQMKSDEFSIKQYVNLINTGNLDTMTDPLNDEFMSIRRENDELIKEDGIELHAIAIDDHVTHIREHRAVIADPKRRQDGDLVARTIKHIEDHIELLRTTDPDLLSMIGQQPLGPPGGSPGGGMQAQGPQQAPPGGQGGPMAPKPQASAQSGAPGGTIPKPAKPPGEFKNQPTSVLPQG